MATVVAGMTMSVDGFVRDAHGSARGLYSDFEDLMDSSYMAAQHEQTGAVMMGRRTFNMADDPDQYADSYEFQVPIFVVTHRAPPVAPRRNHQLFFTCVTDGTKSAVAQATEVAGDRSVLVIGGADLIRQLLVAGLVDELLVDVMPVLLGSGLRFLEDAVPTELEKIGVDEIGTRTSLRFRVKGQ